MREREKRMKGTEDGLEESRRQNNGRAKNRGETGLSLSNPFVELRWTKESRIPSHAVNE